MCIGERKKKKKKKWSRCTGMFQQLTRAPQQSVGVLRAGKGCAGWDWGLGSAYLAVGNSAPPPNQPLIGSVVDKFEPWGRPQRLFTAVSSFHCKFKADTQMPKRLPELRVYTMRLRRLHWCFCICMCQLAHPCCINSCIFDEMLLFCYAFQSKVRVSKA